MRRVLKKMNGWLYRVIVEVEYWDHVWAKSVNPRSLRPLKRTVCGELVIDGPEYVILRVDSNADRLPRGTISEDVYVLILRKCIVSMRIIEFQEYVVDLNEYL